jgi:hypothetical protein
MNTDVLAGRVAESDPVRRWRLQALVRAGYGPTDALVLSGNAQVDLHRAVDLLERGCPVETAMRILL